VHWSVAADHTSARVTGTTERDCDTNFENCTDLGPVPVDLQMAADPPSVYTNDTVHPTRWQGQVVHVYSGGTTYQVAASGTFGPVSLPVTYAADYASLDALTKDCCRNTCEVVSG
jgi:hypothetical protein